MNEASAALSKVCAGCGARYPADALFCPIDGMPLQSAASAQHNGRESEDDPYLGQEISGHIEIRQLVGIGAMGRVYRAFQKGIDRDVAVKILHRELSANAQLVSRFTREAKVASRLQHPNVVQVLLAGQLPDRALYMVMEYLEGLSLQSALAAAGGALPLPKALHIGLQLCEASGEAHTVGIVHRDLKPENVMLVRRGTDPDFVKVLDFGIARINWGEQSVATAAGLIFGTARYISPEGAQGNAVGPPSDVYSIATLLYQMLSGRTPFEGDQAVGLLVQQIHDQPPHLKSIPCAEYVPDPLAEVIMANLVKDPKKREQDARSFGHAIVDAAKQSGLAPEDISRPMLRRAPSAMQLPPTERTKQLDVSPELAERMSPPPSSTTRPEDEVAGEAHRARTAERPLMAATAKWEPPTEFQARLADAVNTPDRSDRSSGVVASSQHAPADRASRPRAPSGVDDTMDDASLEAGLAAKGDTRLTPAPSGAGAGAGVPQRTVVPRTLPGDAESQPTTHYATPAPMRAESRSSAPPPAASSQDVVGPLSSSPSIHPPAPSGQPPPLAKAPPTKIEPANAEGAPPRRGILFVLVCFVLGATIAAGLAWSMGKLGGGGGADQERYISRATDAMYKNRFSAPPGDNVRDITDEGLKKWPNDHRLLDVRMRAANELVSQAMTQRASGDIVEALRLARVAHELDPNDASAKRLVDQYDSEIATFTAPTALPLGKVAAPASVGSKPGPPPPNVPPGPSAAPPVSFKVILEANIAQPRLGQTVEFTARVAPSKGDFDSAVFIISGPGLGGGSTMLAQSPAPGVFKASFSFLEAGRFDISFSMLADGKPLRAGRSLTAGDPPPKPVDPKPPGPTPAGSVKWM